MSTSQSIQMAKQMVLSTISCFTTLGNVSEEPSGSIESDGYRITAVQEPGKSELSADYGREG